MGNRIPGRTFHQVAEIPLSL